MQHKTDIEAAIQAGRVSDIEDAFRALVNWPGEDEIVGLEGMSDAMLLLVATAQRIVDLDDRRIMPAEIFDLIRDLPHGESLAGGTYSAGAEAVLADIGQFRPIFRRTFAEA